MKKQLKWDLERALSLLKEGKKYYEIANILNVSKSSISTYFWRRFGKQPTRISLHRGNIPITQEQKEIIFGTLLGDGNLRFNNSKISVFGRMNHSIKQKEYIMYKRNLLKNLTSEVKPYISKTKNCFYNSLYFTFKSNVQLNKFYYSFYKEGIKIIPEDLSLLTPRAMAIWFMDDGTASNPSIRIATCSFTKEDLQRLCAYLFNTYKLNVTIHSENKLYFKAESARRFKQLILPYMTDSMMYKLKFVK